MTRYLAPDGKVHIIWDSEAEPVDWTTPNVGDGIDDEYCGNCGWDSPGCGCPRDQYYDGTDPKLLPVQKREDPPLPWPPPARKPEPEED
jgi:hypothetical protein